MKIKNLPKIFFISLLLCLFASLPFIYSQSISLKDLLADPEVFDQKEVIVSGEAIGEILETDGGLWVNLVSLGHNLGIFSQVKGDFANISHWGSYAGNGDQIEIRGRFYKNCPQHQTADIHLESLTILKPGHKNKQVVSPRKIQVARLALIICFSVALVYFLKERYGTRA